MKMIEGALERACEKRSRTREGPTPTKSSRKSEPEMDRKGTFASPAVALASSVLPVPGGPTSSAPLGMLAPMSWYRPGFFRKLTNSMISVLASSQPATSLKVTLFLAFLSRTVTFALVTLKMPRAPPPPMPSPMRPIRMKSSAATPRSTAVGIRLNSEVRPVVST